MRNKGAIFQVSVDVSEAITAIACKENDDNYSGDFSVNGVVSPRGVEFTTYAKTDDVAFVLEQLRYYYGFNVNPTDPAEYLYQTPTEAERNGDEFQSLDWFDDGKGGYFRYAIKVELLFLNEYNHWQQRPATQSEIGCAYDGSLDFNGETDSDENKGDN